MRSNITTTSTPSVFSVSPALPVTGTYNFRDLGGIPLRNGGTVKVGQVFRSDAFHRVNDSGRAYLAELGITRFVDLRHEWETLQNPSAVDHDAVEIITVPVLAEAAPEKQFEYFTALTLDAIYDVMVSTRGAALAQAAQHVATAPGPVVFHCTAGKDRTGVLAALMLEAIGAEREAVIADYAATAENLAGEWARAKLAEKYDARYAAADIEAIVTQSPAPLMAELLDRVDEEFGGATAFLRIHGFSPADLAALQTKLIA